MNKEQLDGKNVVVFDKELVQHYEDLGLVIPFKKYVELIIYKETQNLIDRYITPTQEDK